MGLYLEDDRDGADPVGPPRWVKVFAVIGLIILAALVIIVVSSHHGPSRHL